MAAGPLSYHEAILKWLLEAVFLNFETKITLKSLRIFVATRITLEITLNSFFVPFSRKMCSGSSFASFLQLKSL